MIHIEKYHLEEPFDIDESEDSTTIAFCGASAILHPDGSVTPPEYDFVHPKGAHKATCAPCRAQYTIKLFIKKKEPCQI